MIFGRSRVPPEIAECPERDWRPSGWQPLRYDLQLGAVLFNVRGEFAVSRVVASPPVVIDL